DFDRLAREVDTVRSKAVDDRAEGFAKLCGGQVPEREIDAAGRRAAPRFDLFEDRMGRDIARGAINALLVEIIIADELVSFGIEELAAELVAERVPHDGVHADHARRKMPDRKELHELHVDEFRPRAQSERVAIAAHIQRGAVARIE